MSFCKNCGKEIIQNSKFCAFCGAEMQKTPDIDLRNEQSLIKEEQEFLDMTNNLLRWERKAWSICGRLFTVMGIVFASVFGGLSFASFFGAMDLVGYTHEAKSMLVLFFYALTFGGFILAIGIIQRKVANKMPIYLDSLYNDFSVTNDRSGNVGMLVFAIIFGGVHTVFFIINFVRLKSGANIIKRILARQGKN